MLSFTCAVLPLVALVSSVRSQGVTFHVEEEQRVRTSVGNVIDGARLYDEYTAEVLSKLNFRFRDNSALFEITSDTGDIRTRRVLDREELSDCMFSSQCVFELEVVITPYAYFKIVPVTIHVDDINDNAPEFPQPRISLDIPESITVNTSSPLPVAEDPDSEPFGIVKYELVTSTRDFGLSVNTLPSGEKDLELIVLRKLDSETKNFYSLDIRATDGGDPPKSGILSVDITIGDSNDNRPMFDKREYVVHIYENLEVNSPVQQVSAQDLDQGRNGRIFFEFDHYTQENFGEFFGINNRSGLVFVKGEIDYEEHKLFHLTVTATDLGGSTAPDSAKVIVHVRDVNDNPPIISVNTFTDNEYAKVPENVPSNHTVAYVGIVDPDTGSGGNITCRINNGYFTIRGSSSGSSGFTIVSAQSFDREIQDEYSLLVQCQDQGTPQLSSSVTIPILVTDKNDNSPKFIPNTALYAISIAENNKIGDTIMKVNASDADTMENAAIRYTIEPVGDTPKAAVSIDLITGVIKANIEFDFERRDFYQYKIMATDQGTPAHTVDTLLNLNILDVNDGIPHFIQSAYSFNVLENQVAKTTVGEVAAVDNDAPPFNHIVYSLQPGHDSYKFHIDPDTGRITTATIIDREESKVYHLTCVASNRDAPEIKAMVNITVHIDDINDNPPLMLFPNDNNNTIQVPTRMDIGFHITQIEAVDPDDMKNGQLKFGISSGNEGGIFQIDPDTGAISAAASTDMPNLKKQMLVLKVKDRGEPEKVTFAMLNVVFNSSVAVTQGMMTGNTLTLLIVAAVGGCAFIVIVISIAICCIRRSRDKKDQKEHVYNCRAEEMKKALENGGDRLKSSKGGDPAKEKCVDTGISKTKEKSKKEVTFSVDMDQGWPAQNEKAVIENPHAQHIDPSDCHPLAHPLDRERPQQEGEIPDENSPQRMVHRNGGRPVSRQSSCCTCAKHEGRQMPPLTQQNLDMLEYWQNTVDRDSESGCSGTDSGRGPSEEGECGGGHAHGGGDGGHHAHDTCGHGTCCCSSGIYAKRYHQQAHLHPAMYNNYPGPTPRGCHCCGPAVHAHCGGSHCGGSTCGSTDLNKSACSTDECTPLEALPAFGRHHFRDRMYGPKVPHCRGGPRGQRLHLDPEEMAKNRQYGFAPSLPSLTDPRHTPSPTFTSTSDSQYFPYTGAHPRQPMPYKGFVPVGAKSPSDRSISDDGTGTTMSGSYSMDTMKEETPGEIRLEGQTGDCYV